MSEAIFEHLMSRPIASIAKTQAESEVGLKLMAIVDYMLEESQLYAEILQHPKLLDQLIRFKQYDQFHYYEYKLKKVPFEQWLLECQCCNFAAPYTTTLEHMVLNHGRHQSAELCQWCGVLPIRAHIESKTLDQCYREYSQRHQINVSAHVRQIIGEVYKQLRRLAADLGVRSTRQNSYRACNSTSTEIIPLNDIVNDEISTEVVVTKPNVRNKTMNFNQLDFYFKRAMQFFNEDTKQLRYSPFQMYDPSVPQMPPMQQIPMQQQHQQQHQPSSLQSPWTQNPWVPPHQVDTQSSEVANLASFVTYALQTIRSDSIRTRAHFDIRKNILKFLAEDLQYQLQNQWAITSIFRERKWADQQNWLQYSNEWDAIQRFSTFKNDLNLSYELMIGVKI